MGFVEWNNNTLILEWRAKFSNIIVTVKYWDHQFLESRQDSESAILFWYTFRAPAKDLYDSSALHRIIITCRGRTTWSSRARRRDSISNTARWLGNGVTRQHLSDSVRNAFRGKIKKPVAHVKIIIDDLARTDVPLLAAIASPWATNDAIFRFLSPPLFLPFSRYDSNRHALYFVLTLFIPTFYEIALMLLSSTVYLNVSVQLSKCRQKYFTRYRVAFWHSLAIAYSIDGGVLAATKEHNIWRFIDISENLYTARSLHGLPYFT